MKIILNFSMAVLLFSLFTGCASVGKDFDSEKVKNIQNNVTTQLEIVDWFGVPFKEGTENGYTMWTYQKDKWKAVGDAESKGLVILFDDKNKVKAYRYESNY
ncbi:MAG: hypothetical protein H8E32_17810 [Nitrospinae bacterium]|nr:hypothetical protein [Nitrospinota bacterium]